MNLFSHTSVKFQPFFFQKINFGQTKSYFYGGGSQPGSLKLDLHTFFVLRTNDVQELEISLYMIHSFPFPSGFRNEKTRVLN